jgi:hypothetical protein
MKKLFITVAFAALVGLTSFAADITKVNQRVLAAFEKEFTTASNVTWELLKGQEIFHASFTYSNEIMEAYYSEEGDLIGAARHISPERLPLLVAKSLRQNFGQYTFKQASEYMCPETTSYIVTLENEKATLIVRIYISGNAEVIKKTKKS